ncbi:MAG: TonB-dependent receptor [Acetobacter sp.]|nr:TonB-dependent receptor [Acetobacter sp.]
MSTVVFVSVFSTNYAIAAASSGHLKKTGHHNRQVANSPAKISSARVETAPASGAPAASKPTHSLYSHSNEEVRVDAARVIGRSATSPSTPVNSTTPVTVISGAALAATGQNNVMQALAQLSPAITSPAVPGIGGNAFTQTMQLRGLSADETLILVNGHRRHIGANFNANAGPNWGTEPADIGLIPMSAIDHVEVITEGATALYGQDALAGAVNIVLKSDTHGGSVNFKNSGFYGGDGQSIDGTANMAFALGHQGGYLDIAAQIVHQLPAFRNGDYKNSSRYPNDMYYALPDGSTDPRSSRSRNVQRSNGLPKKTTETLSANMSLPITDTINLYSTSTYGHRNVSVGQAYRSAADDLTVTALWPNGMQPYYLMEQNDFEVDNGFKGHNFGFAWDTYVNYGKDMQSYDLKDTDNASYGTASQTRFHTGSAAASQLSAGFKASRNIDVGFLPKPVGLEFGAEYRRDTFTLGAGEYASYASGGVPILTGPDTGKTAAPGAATHAGNPAYVAGKYTRDVFDGHVNLDFYITPKWEWTLGGRTVAYHNYPVVSTGSIGTRYNFNKRWSVRANINTGFRPPTLGQTYYYYNSPQATYSTLSLPNNSAAAQALGAGKLKGEYSRSFTVGFDATPVNDWHLTGNLYYIAINDRLASTTTLSGSFVSETLNAYGMGNATFASYYSNPVNTNTWGGDLSTDYTLRTKRYGAFRFAFAVNFSDNEIRSYNSTPAVLQAHGLSSYNAYAVAELIHSSPKNRETLSVNWTKGKWSVLVEEMRYGSSVFIAAPNLPTNLWTNIHPAFITNMEVAYKIMPKWRVAIGADNLGNKYPTRVKAAAAASNNNLYIYPTSSPFGYFGGMYYVNTSINF